MLTEEFRLEEALKVREEEVTKEVTKRNWEEFRKLLESGISKEEILKQMHF
jgi:type II secretory pathway component PulF